MRQIVLDTETTGLEANRGHRVIEIGCIELVQRRPTGRQFHRYLNPQRAIDDGAREVTGLTEEFLADKPLFESIADEFLDFIRGAELIIHNAAFDVGFLNAELARAGAQHGRLSDHAGVLDTLALAREKYPGQRNSLDALCKRLEIDNSHRELHGALLDSQLLAEVYLAMTAGQGALDFALDAAVPQAGASMTPASTSRPPLLVRVADASELAAHVARLAGIDKASKGACLWLKLEAQTAESPSESAAVA
jgi:DNA polymerase-3 subunit epsilon